MLNVGELSRISKELILGLAPTNTSQEASMARREIAEDLAKMRVDGVRNELVQFTVVEPPTQRPCRILMALSAVLRAALS